MSANGEGGIIQEDNVCRDFLRNVCNRGNRCKFRHPEPGEAAELAKKVEYVFCHDFQNKECLRTNCKFLHCTKQEEEHYRFSGELPSGALERLASGKNDATVNKMEVPICKDYLKGDCRRGNRCRFRHINSSSEYEMQMGMNSNLAERKRDRFDQYERYSFSEFEPEPKRHLYNDRCPTYGIEHQVLGPSYRLLEEENNMLRRKVNELKKQVSDMTATNEFLLDQNAQLRLSKQTTTVSPVSQTLIPHTIPPSVAPIPSGMTQIPLNNSDLSVAAAQTTIQPQRIASELAAAAAASQTMAQIPVTLGQVPVSIANAALSINQAIPAVSLAQSIHQSIITMSGPATPLVSYPIMTRSMRPIIPQSLGQ